MRDRLGKNTRLGYCTNVHAGDTPDKVRENLTRYACAVRENLALEEPLGIGLWLSASAARDIVTSGAAQDLRDWLCTQQLDAFTFNGFPYGDFHQDVVKHAVYQPDWADARRMNYTRDLVQIMQTLMADGDEGSISTLPIGWPGLGDMPETIEPDNSALQRAAQHLLTLADELRAIHVRTGKTIHIDLEPEPGCLLQRSGDVVRFFELYLLPGASRETVTQHLRVCHDVCHAAVMFGPQEDAIANYTGAGIRIGKVQISAAVAVPALPSDEDAAAALAELAQFVEPRYLHQSLVRDASGAATFYEDLPRALANQTPRAHHQWRVHFHVPIFLSQIGRLHSTHDQIAPALRACRAMDVRHYEVETYAWDVLPQMLRQPLAQGIAAELAWVLEQAEY